MARLDLLAVRLLVDPPLTSRRPFEMLDRIREVQLLAVETGFFEGVIEHPPGRADEGHAGQILLISWLLADEHRIGR